MTQSTINLPNSNGYTFRQSLNAALETLATDFTGSVLPTNPVADQTWRDTSVSPSIVRRRNTGNTAWEVPAVVASTVAEGTSGGGVTVDGLLIKDGGIGLVDGSGAGKIGFTQAATNSVVRTVSNKIKEIGISPEDFGAKGDFDPATFTGTDDSAAFNLMLDWARTQVLPDPWGVPQFTKFAITLRPGAIYRINSTLNFTGLRSRTVHVYGNGATLYAMSNNNTPMIDMVYSMGVHFHDLLIYAENGAYSGSLVQPSYGIVIGRKDSADGSEHSFTNVRFAGWFNNACLMNIAGELISYTKCAFENNVAKTSNYTGLCVHVTDTNEAGYTSTFQTMSALPAFGTNEQLFTQCNINATQGVPVRLSGALNSCKFHQCYAAVLGNRPAVILKGTFRKLELDIHVETGEAKSNVEFDNSTTSVSIRGFRLRDHQPQAANLMTVTGGVGAVDIRNGEIEVGGTSGPNGSTIRIAPAGSLINYHGDIYLSVLVASLYEFGGFASYSGSLYCNGSAIAVSQYPTAGSIRIVSAADGFTTVVSSQAGVAVKIVGEFQAHKYRDQNGAQVVGVRQPAITQPTGGTVIDVQARAAIDAIRTLLSTHGLSA